MRSGLWLLCDPMARGHVAVIVFVRWREAIEHDHGVIDSTQWREAMNHDRVVESQESWFSGETFLR